MRLKMKTPVGVPDQFTLLIKPSGGKIAVEAAWRTQNEVGARIV
ncbi:hypothetical protein ACRBEV_24995 [Methylobacterium phyllosphaerae]